ncbi:MAG: type IV pili twitching motility protein PilT [Planctomycetes bacterium]|nr:type IV pili twitching motility protein PilT [Planctomycetota bacterium]
MLDMDRVLATVVEADASDLILKTGSQPAMKQAGRVLFLAEEPVLRDDVRAVLEQIAYAEALARFDAEGESDFAFEHPNRGRFRVNAFRQSGEISIVMRQVKSVVPSFRELCLPERQFSHFAELSRGIVFVTGITGSGKSTSLAATVDSINNTRNEHILTLEDPIEYRFVDNLSLINQREVGVDTRNWITGLRNAMREAPDVIMLGEIRDTDTMEAAIAAAETGHLVLTTLHTVNAIQTVERIMTFFPPHQHELVRLQLSMTLEGVASQRLIPCVQTGRMVPAVELLIATPRIREILRAGQTHDLSAALQDGAEYYGTQTFNMSLKKLYEDGMVTLEDACAASDNADDLKLAIRGVVRGTDHKVLSM